MRNITLALLLACALIGIMSIALLFSTSEQLSNMTVVQQTQAQTGASVSPTGLHPTISESLSPAQVLARYIAAGEACAPELMSGYMSADSNNHFNPSCDSWQREVACYKDLPNQETISGTIANVHFVPFTQDGPSPFLFVREYGSWKIDFSRMANGITFGGGSCAGPWKWRTNVTRDYFCDMFPRGTCPDN